MDIVGDDEEVVVSWGISSNGIVKVVFGVLDEQRRVVVVIISIGIKVHDMVAESLELRLASSVALGVRRAHIRREVSENVAKSHLVLDHLVLSLGSSESRQVLMSPGMAGNLMTFGSHTLDGGRIAEINLALSKVVAGDKERSLGVVGLEHIQDIVGIDVGAIVKG
jgi:hypothetical protein